MPLLEVNGQLLTWHPSLSATWKNKAILKYGCSKDVFWYAVFPSFIQMAYWWVLYKMYSEYRKRNPWVELAFSANKWLNVSKQAMFLACSFSHYV